MNKKNLSIAAAAVVIIGGLAAYYFLSENEPAPVPVQVKAPPPPPPPAPVKPAEPVKVVEIPPAQPPLPSLGASDSVVLDATAGLVKNKSLMKLFRTDRIIHNIVATIDNLPSRRAPMSVLPVKRVPGQFISAGPDSDLVISPMNAARYTPYVKLFTAIEPKQMIGLYIRLHPLFQQAYEELGYPDENFNDRLIEVIDELLAAPNIKEPVKLVQPNVFYLFANPEYEARSIGQRILMRIGSHNESAIKAQLRAIKQELMLQIHDKKL